MKLSSLFGVDIYDVYMIYPLIGNIWKNGLNKLLKTRGKRGVSPAPRGEQDTARR